MPYERSQAQQRFLRRKYAQQKDEETCCDCPGGMACPDYDNKGTCKGFVRGCVCDVNNDWKLLTGRRKDT